MPDRPSTNKGFTNLLHLYPSHEPGKYTMTFQSTLECHCVDNCTKHSHVITLYPVNSKGFCLSPSENISPSNDNGQLYPKFTGCLNLTGVLLQNFGIKAGGF